MRPGGFRLRYGRSRNTSFAAAGISPASMYIMDSFIVSGTQLKVERPGKAAGMAPVDSLEGPTVRLRNGDIIRVDDEQEAIKIHPEVETIIDIGEILINYGDFLENNHPLVPSSYCFEWWIQEFEKAVENSPYSRDELKDPSQELALELCEKYNTPLHPAHTYLWHDISVQEYEKLAYFVSENGVLSEGPKILELPLALAKDSGIKTILEHLLVLHKLNDKKIIIEKSASIYQVSGTGCGT